LAAVWDDLKRRKGVPEEELAGRTSALIPLYFEQTPVAFTSVDRTLNGMPALIRDFNHSFFRIPHQLI
jgi:hypothetical protein